jgi:MoxR-like ATPase
MRDGRAYVMTDALHLAVKVALATNRPLLVRGGPGSGKSSLAAHVAYFHDWRYYEFVTTSRSSAQDLLWSFDPVRRFGDVTGRVESSGGLNEHNYVSPGVLWWLFDRESAYRRGAYSDGTIPSAAAQEPFSDINSGRDSAGAVLLIDEIDKADPDLPNGILVALGSGEFVVTETGVRITRKNAADSDATLIIITTNEERELPEAFLRRCLSIELPEHGREKLVEIALEHLKKYEEYEVDEVGRVAALADSLAEELTRLRRDARTAGRRPPSTAEYLDALRACLRLGISVGDTRWDGLRDLTLTKL